MAASGSKVGSVQSLQKAVDNPGSNSSYRNLSQHCSACARVKKENNKMNPSVNLDLPTQFLFSLPSWLCCETFTWNMDLSWTLSQSNPVVLISIIPALWPSVPLCTYHQLYPLSFTCLKVYLNSKHLPFPKAFMVDFNLLFLCLSLVVLQLQKLLYWCCWEFEVSIITTVFAFNVPK